MRYRYYTADVFTDRIFGGNPLAVFPDAGGLSAEQMQRVARELNLSETVFVRPPEDTANTRRLRIFTPAMELPFAGHPTLGCAHVLALLGEIKARDGETEITFEEGIGPITVRIQADGGRPGFTQLDVAKMPEFAMEIPSLRSVASALSLDISDLLLGDDRPVAVSCGVPFLVVPLRSLEALGRARLDRETWESSLQDTWAPNLYAFVYDAETEGADLRARVFAPALGVEEDPATGAGAASLAGYLCALDAKGQGSRFWTLEQGFEMGRPSLIKLEADLEQGKVIAIRVGGASVLVGEAWIEVPGPGEHGGLVPQTGTETGAETGTETGTEATAGPKAGAETARDGEPAAEDAAAAPAIAKPQSAKPQSAKPQSAKPGADGTAGPKAPAIAPVPAARRAPESAVRSEGQPEAGSAPKAATGAKAEARAQPEAGTEAEARPEPEAGSAPKAEAKAKSEPAPDPKAEAEAKPAAPEKKPEAKAEPAAVPGGPAKAGGDKVVPLRAVLEALTARQAETTAPVEGAAEPAPEASGVAGAEDAGEPAAPAAEDPAAAAPKAGPGRRIGFVVDRPGAEETEARAGAAGPPASAQAEGTGKAPAAYASMAALARKTEPPPEEEGPEAERPGEDDHVERETKGVEDDDGLRWDDGDPEYEDEAEGEEDWDDGEDGGLDEDLRRFRRQEHYKFLWSATLRHGDQIYACVIIDLSPKAALVQLEEELAYDLTLKFDSPVTLRNDKIGRIKGEVAWRDKNRLGVELLEDPEEISKILDAARG